MNRSVLSPIDRQRPTVRWSLRVVHALLLVVLVIVGLGPVAVARQVGDLDHPGHAALIR